MNAGLRFYSPRTSRAEPPNARGQRLSRRAVGGRERDSEGVRVMGAISGWIRSVGFRSDAPPDAGEGARCLCALNGSGPFIDAKYDPRHGPAAMQPSWEVDLRPRVVLATRSSRVCRSGRPEGRGRAAVAPEQPWYGLLRQYLPSPRAPISVS
jgi:hypothetical protein